MTNLTEILREFANEPEWTPGFTKGAHYPALFCDEHNRLVAKNRALVSELEKLTSKIREAGFDQAGASRISRAQIYESDLDRIAVKLAAALASER